MAPEMDSDEPALSDVHRLLAEWSPDAASIHDISGRYLWASPGFFDLLGIDPHDLVGRDAYEFFHPDDVPDIQISHQTVVELPATFSVQYRIRRGDGTYRWVETTSRTSDEHDVIIALTRGIDERRSLLDALETERLISSRLRRLDRERHEFLTTISHRARHPITVLLGYAQTLRTHRHALSDDAVDNLLDRMIGSVAKMRELVDDVTEAERLGRRVGRLEVRPLAVAKIARDVVETLADPDSPISVGVAESTVVFADAQLLRIALHALLKNAIRHPVPSLG
jgi:PAS domain S-box-containing protein